MKFNFEESLTRKEALEILLKKWTPTPKEEVVSVDNSIGRYSAEDVFASYDAPLYRTSSFDGIAVSSDRFKNGIPDTSFWQEGKDFARADTGDDFPDEFDAIIAIEDIELNNGKLKIKDFVDYVVPNANVRKAGSICQKGELLIGANTKITPMLASMLTLGGKRFVKVIKKPKIAYIPTGDELISVGEVPKRGETIESNSVLVKGMAEEMGAEAVIFPIIRDNKKDLETALDEAISIGDIIIINGGSSRGSEDFNSELLEEKSSFFKHGIRAAPGRPVGIAIIDGKVAINMPGPPIASFIALDWCVRGLVAAYFGTKPLVRSKIKATLADDIKKRKDFEMYYQFDITNENGKYIAHFIPRSKTLPSTAISTKAMLIAPIENEGYKTGEKIELELMCGNEFL